MTFRPGEDATSYHYRRLHEELRDRGIRHVAMQYPTLAETALRARFENAPGRIDPAYREILFVGNEDNFAAALSRLGYDALFYDRFRHSFGHFTEEGHRLVADRLVEELLEAGLLPLPLP